MLLPARQIIKAILNDNFFIGRKEVNDLEEVAAVVFSEKARTELSQLLLTGAYHQLTSLRPCYDILVPTLYVVRFTDEKEQGYYALYYHAFDRQMAPHLVALFIQAEKKPDNKTQ